MCYEIKYKGNSNLFELFIYFVKIVLFVFFLSSCKSYV
jgi:hypothetical protein